MHQIEKDAIAIQRGGRQQAEDVRMIRQEAFNDLREPTQDSHCKNVTYRDLKEVGECGHQAVYDCLAGWRARVEVGPEEVELGEGEEEGKYLKAVAVCTSPCWNAEHEEAENVVEPVPPNHYWWMRAKGYL